MELKPDWVKGYCRLGAAHHGLRDFERRVHAPDKLPLASDSPRSAVAAYKRGLELEPTNEQLTSGLAEVQAAERRHEGGGGSSIGSLFSAPNAMAKIMAHPSTRPYLQQPDFVQMLSEVQRDASQAERYLSDARMMKVLGVLLGLDIQHADAAGADRREPPSAAAAAQEADVEMGEAELAEKQQARTLTHPPPLIA